MRVLHIALVAITLHCAGGMVASDLAWADGQDTVSADKPPEEPPSKLKAVIAYGLSIAAAFVVLAIVVHTLSRTLKYEQARNAIVHLLRTNPNQAEIQCRTMPHSFYDAIGAAIQGGAMTGGTRELSMIQQATVPSYDAGGAQVSQYWKGLIGKAKLAGMAAIGGIALKPSALPIILAVVVACGFGWLLYYKSQIDRSLFRAKVEVLPDVERAFADGRYYIAPKPP